MTFVIFVAPLFSDSASAMVVAAGSLPGVRLGVITQDPLESAPAAAHSLIAAHWRVKSVIDAGEISGAVHALAAQHGRPTRLFGAYEQLQVPLAQVREELGIEGMSVETALNFRDKFRMKNVLRAAGVPCARHALVESEAQAWDFVREVGLPLVLKPPAGAGAQATHRVATSGELRDVLARNVPTEQRPVLIEEFITGQEHSLETISIDGEPVWNSLTEYFPTPLQVLENPWMQWCVVLPRETNGPEYADIRDTGARALRALGMTTGLTHMEWFRRGDGRLVISEVAARPPGAQITTLVSRANDIDFVQAWARVTITGEFEQPVQKYAVGAAYLRGQGRGSVKAVHGLQQVQSELGGIIVDAGLPVVGQVPTGSYEGEGYIIVRHSDTAVVEQAVQRIVSLVRVELGVG
ncbi:MAG: ATP-grasp domain-containing protein [Gemmatimonadaceae bacterium]